MTRPTSPNGSGRRLDLLATLPPLAWLARRRWFPLAISAPLLVLTALFVTAGLAGTPVGNRNGLVVFVWILWWFLLIAVLVPFGARAWCGACPIPLVGDWLQRRRLVGVRSADPRQDEERPGRLIGRNRYSGAARRWPRKLSNIWIQSLGFLLFATFSVVLLTSPLASALAILGMVVAATAVAARYRQRTFCRYLCPVGGFLGLYSKASTLAVRSRDAAVCAACREKSCLAGSDRGWGCPWLEYPSRLEGNDDCGLCLECVTTCPHENMSLFLRPPFEERRLGGWDQAFKAFLMLALVIAYSAVYLGPWGSLKAAANIAEGGDWVSFGAYAAGLWGLALLVVPGLFVGAAWLGRRLVGEHGTPIRPAVLAGAASLVPFGLMAWIAFSVPLVLVNGSYVVTVASDPFGWGWDLFGTAGIPWTPVLPHWAPWLQAGLLLVGQWAGIRSGWREWAELSGEDRRGLLGFGPTAVLVTLATLLLLRFFAG